MKRSFMSTLARRKWILVTAVVVLLLVVWWRRRAAASAIAAAPAQQFATVSRGTIRATIACSGTIQAETEVDVKSQAGGEVTSLLVREGDHVKAGDLIATIDPADSQTSVRTSQADVTGSQAAVSQARAQDRLTRAAVPASIQNAIEGVKGSRAKLRLAEENLTLAGFTTESDVLTSEQDRALAASKGLQAGTNKTLTEGTSSAALLQAQQERESAASRLASAQASVALAQDNYLHDLEKAHQNRAAAASKLDSAQLSASTSPAASKAALAAAQEQLAASEQKLAKLAAATQPTEVAAAQGERDAAGAVLAQAQADTKRQRELFAKGFVPYATVEAAATTEAAANSRYQNSVEISRVLKDQQGSDTGQAESAVRQARANLQQAQEAVRASGTTTFDVAQATASLRAAEQDVKLAEAAERNVTLRQEDVRQAQAALHGADAAVESTRAQLLQVSLRGSEVEQAQEALRRAETVKAQAEANRRTVKLRQADVDSARAALAQSEAQLTQIMADRYSIVKNAGAVTQASATVIKNQANLENAQKQLRDTIVRAPRDGVVTVRNVEEGTVISSAKSSVTAGTTIVTLADINQLYCLGQVDESDVAKVSIGQKASFSVESYGDRKFAATVRKVYPKGVTTNNVTQFTVELAVLKNDAKLRPGMTADIEVLTDERPNALVLPSEAVREGSGGYYVLAPLAPGTKPPTPKDSNGVPTTVKAGEENTTRVPVKVGTVATDQIEVVGGVKEGDKVLVGSGTGGSQSTAGASKASDQMQKAIGQGMKGIGGK